MPFNAIKYGEAYRRRKSLLFVASPIPLAAMSSRQLAIAQGELHQFSETVGATVSVEEWIKSDDFIIFDG
jgi:hypothetical protein